MISCGRRHIHFDERRIGDLVLQRDAIAKPSESADIAIGQALGLAYRMNVAVNAATRSRIPKNLPGYRRAKRGYLILAKTKNSCVWYRFYRAQVTETFAVEEHKPYRTAIYRPVYGSVIDVVTICWPRRIGRWCGDKLTLRIGLQIVPSSPVAADRFCRVQS